MYITFNNPVLFCRDIFLLQIVLSSNKPFVLCLTNWLWKIFLRKWICQQIITSIYFQIMDEISKYLIQGERNNRKTEEYESDLQLCLVFQFLFKFSFVLGLFLGKKIFPLPLTESQQILYCQICSISISHRLLCDAYIR